MASFLGGARNDPILGRIDITRMASFLGGAYNDSTTQKKSATGKP